MNKKVLGRLTALVLAVLALLALTGCATTTTDAAATESTGSSMSMILIFVVMIVVFYFFLIRPENKKKKELQQMRSELSVGDDITTIGGIVGKVVYVSDDAVVFETGDDRVRLKVAKWAISTKGKATAEEPK